MVQQARAPVLSLNLSMTTVALSLLLAASQVQEDLPPLGTNLAAFSEATTQWPLVDAFKMSRPWQLQKPGGSLEIDVNGNVKALPSGQVAETIIYANGHCPKGTYTLLWEGSGEFDATNGSTLTAVSEGKATVDVKEGQGISLLLKKVDSQNPPRNIRLIMPGFEDVAEVEPFHPVFLQRMSLYRVFRFADWQATDNSKQKAWMDRPKIEDATYAAGNGVPLETMVSLANTKFSSPWFSVPHQANDEYVREMAKLIKERLRPEIKVIIEYSSKCWDQTQGQAKWCIEQGKKEKLSTDDSEAGLRYYAQRSQQVFAIFEQEFGGKARLLRVLSADLANAKSAETILSWKRAASSADLLAVAPYFGKEAGLASNLEQTKVGGLDALFVALKGEVAGSLRDQMFEYAGIAERNRLKLVAFEGGQHLLAVGPGTDDSALNNLFDEANRDQRMGETYTAYLKTWRSAGGLLFVHYNDCGPWTKAGRWGTIEYQDQDPQPSQKNRAMIQYALFPDR